MANTKCDVTRVLESNPKISVSLDRALRDLAAGFCQWPRWMKLGNREIVRRYRRSVLGPLWITLSTAITVAALSMVYAAILQTPMTGYVAYVATGLVIWIFISGTLAETTTVFIDSGFIVQQMSAPLSVHVYRVAWQNLWLLLHNAIIVVAALVIAHIRPAPVMLLAFPAFVLVYINLLWLGLLCALVSVRFRDVPRLVTQLLQLSLLVTPVFWRLPPDPLILQITRWNPFYYLIGLVRQPLLGQLPDSGMLAGGGRRGGPGMAFTVILYSRYRWRVAYWL